MAAVAAGYLMHRWGGDAWGGRAAATAGAMGETVGFYGASFAELRRDREVRDRRSATKSEGLAKAVDKSWPIAETQ